MLHNVRIVFFLPFVAGRDVGCENMYINDGWTTIFVQRNRHNLQVFA